MTKLKSGNLHSLLFLVLMLSFTAIVFTSLGKFSASFDETSHIASGYSYLETSKIELNKQHPPLVKLLSALPLKFLDLKSKIPNKGWGSSIPNEWDFGFEFLYSNDADQILFLSRMPILLLAILLGFFVYRLSLELFGKNSALLSLMLYAFSPNIIAHSHLVTMDLALSCFSFGSFYFLWKFYQEKTSSHFYVACIFLSLALLSKFSALIFLIPFGLLILINEKSLSKRFHNATRCALILVVIVSSFYFTPFNLDLYIEGLRKVQADHQQSYLFYLNGEFGRGWWHYFLLAFLFKTPLLTIFLILCGIFQKPQSNEAKFLIMPAFIFLLVTSAFAHNAGIRYILPIYPFLFVLAGSSIVKLRPKLQKALLCMATVYFCTLTYFIYPDQLAYFNEIAEGPSNGYNHLDDSNIDWGYDLKRLKQYLDANPKADVTLLYPWNGSPEYYGISHRKLANLEWSVPKSGVTYVISTHALIRGKLLEQKTGLKTDWLTRYKPVARIGYSFYIFQFS
ncbi:MAG: glycosyltransferase family 39 protein [Deltaproteobacteria bacterium]|nr:glycosyltransferase family 39 protein [Deltaproteobacteria bacterium]